MLINTFAYRNIVINENHIRPKNRKLKLSPPCICLHTRQLKNLESRQLLKCVPLSESNSDTLRRWLKQGRITTKTSPSGTRLYDISSIFPELTSRNADNTNTTATATTTTTKKGFLYARVSSVKQKEDLERQKQLLSSRFSTYELVSDIGLGVNFKRPGLKTLLEQSSRRVVSEIVVTHCDRLCQFAFDLIQYVLSLHATKIVVLFNDTTSDEHELSQDILAINTVFICRMQGKRAALHRRERQNRRNKQEEESHCNKSTHQTTTLERNSQSYTTSQSVPQPSSETIIETLDGIGEVCL